VRTLTTPTVPLSRATRAPLREIAITPPAPSATRTRQSRPSRLSRSMCEYATAWLIPSISRVGSTPAMPSLATHPSSLVLPGPGWMGGLADITPPLPTTFHPHLP
jgi:hypothetical protein